MGSMSEPDKSRYEAEEEEEEDEDDEEESYSGRRKLAGKMAIIALVALAVVTGSLAGITLIYSADLPQIADLEKYRPSTTTELYDRKGRVIGSFALERRILVNYNDFSPVLRQAVISIEDKNFESHGGINFFRIFGALIHDLRTHGRYQGASTLTMQLARNLFLSSERTAGRKVQEAYLAIQMERALTKQQIFTLYGNQIYLGHGMYGFEAASEYFFSKHANNLTLTEAALLAGLPKGPVGYSPILSPDKCLRRRNLVLTEMESDHTITHDQAEAARNAPLGLHIAPTEGAVAPWFQEEVRRELEKRFGSEEVHEAGLKVETTLDLDVQQTANRAVLEGLAAYEHRHGWTGKLENALSSGSSLEEYKHPDWVLTPKAGAWMHALVLRVEGGAIHARVGNQETLILPEDWQWTGKSSALELVRPGDVIYVHLAASGPGRASLEQDSGTQGSLMAMENTTGDVLAMVGGRDYALSQFNRATQSERQTGSSFKPYVYTAAMEDGAKPDDTIVDGPVSFGGYTPHNYENDYKGTMTLTNAFAESRNIPAIKLAARVGIHKVIDVAHRFGVTSTIPAYLPVALGAVEITLQEQVASYSVFPNDGLRVQPRYIRKVMNADGVTLWSETPEIKEVINQDTSRRMMTLLRAVTAFGTGAQASQLNHPLGGKTGTTSNYTDAWFLGFSPSITCGVWVGYDSRESLGDKETGSRAALPIWMEVMKTALVGRDKEEFLADQDAKNTTDATDKSPTKDNPQTASPTAPKTASKPTQKAVAKPAQKAVIKPMPKAGSPRSGARTAGGKAPSHTTARGTSPHLAERPKTRPSVHTSLPEPTSPMRPVGSVKSALG